MVSHTHRRRIIAWALYDWANSTFATTVMAGFFPVFFKQYWAAGMAVTESSFQLGLVNSVASIVMVVLAPLLGAIGDRSGSKKRFLLFFAMMGVVMTGGLFMVAAGHWVLALMLYAFALLGFTGGNIFYDALLVEVARERELDRVSALGYALGYAGGGLLFAFDILLTLHPRTFGLENAAEAVRYAFLSVAVWWAVFTLPLMIFVHAQTSGDMPLLQAVRGGIRQLAATFHKVRRLRMVGLFLAAYWLYIDGVDTVVRMAVDYGLSLGFEANALMIALLITQFVGFPAALLFGRIGERRGPKQGIMLAIFIYFLVILWAYRMDESWEFYALAVAVGLVQGGIQALSRSFYARLIPTGEAGEFFGFYNMLGKFAAVIGPVMMGWVGVVTGDSRYGILSIALLFVAGGVLLGRVHAPAGRRAV